MTQRSTVLRLLALLLPELLLLAPCACSENRTEVARDDYEPATIEPLPCVPDLDGAIQSDEVAAAIGVPIRYLVSPAGEQREVDTTGWDLSVDQASDQQVTVVPTEAKDRWYGDQFPADAFVTPFDAGGSVESIARLDGDSLWLLGLASRDEDPPEGQTLVVYEQAVATLQFPIEPGVSFTSQGSVSGGMLRGLPYAGVDTYEVTVDATGELELPQLVFTQAHRIHQHVTVQPAVGAATSQRRVSWFFECFAEVARAVSLPDEQDPNFTTAAEVWRLGLQ